MKIDNPYHDGERTVQAIAGVLDESEKNSRLIQDSIIKGAQGFVHQQSLVMVGSLDRHGQVWASMVIGTPGFMYVVDERRVSFDMGRMRPNHHDPFWENIQGHASVGMLAIDLVSRRRLRFNGRITRISDATLHLHVEEAYPNCSKYIHTRRLRVPQLGWVLPPYSSTQGERLEPHQRTIITQADTFFVASAHPDRGVDVSHRGGNPGFVKIVDDRILCIPDYVGNAMFNTLGNFTVNPRAGLIFLDFESGRALQLIGRPEIFYDVEDFPDETKGTNRYWELHVERWLETDYASALRWEFLETSSSNGSPTGPLEREG